MAIMQRTASAYPRLIEYTNAFIKLNEDGSANLALIGSSLVEYRKRSIGRTHSDRAQHE